MPDVLVVDDDEIIRGMLAFLFEGEGFRVAQASDGTEALARLQEDTPECMVLDLMMPGVDGLTVLRTRAAQGLAPDTRVVILTAKTGSNDAIFCWEAGADEYLTKPFDPQKLVRVVRDLRALTPEEAKRRREVGLAEAKRLDAIEAALRER